MAHVVALYRYPVKGFTPEPCPSLTVLEEGRIAGDRVLAFRFADSTLPETAWSRKYGFTVLANTPGLARLRLRFDHSGLRLSLTLDGELLVEDGLDESGRRRIAEAVERFVVGLRENPLTDHRERRPLRLVGDGVTSRYQDNEEGQITLHSRESVAALAAALRASRIDEARFRSNVAIEGVDAWDEQDWIGRKVTMGDVEFDAVRPKVRCLATHADPDTGERDLPVMQTLVRAFQQQEPMFAVALMPRGAGGVVRVGDQVTVERE
ncbi:MAG: MOSC domain-containing protein [Burkholderiales bacterium]